MSRICLVSGSKSQMKTRALADRLYTSTLFQRASRYAVEKCDRWFILSARHGLVAPGQVIEPYDIGFNDLSDQERFEWAQNVMQFLLRERITTHDTLILLASKSVREYLVPVLESRRLRFEIPIEGMNAVEQMRWLGQVLS